MVDFDDPVANDGDGRARLPARGDELVGRCPPAPVHGPPRWDAAARKTPTTSTIAARTQSWLVRRRASVALYEEWNRPMTIRLPAIGFSHPQLQEVLLTWAASQGHCVAARQTLRV